MAALETGIITAPDELELVMAAMETGITTAPDELELVMAVLETGITTAPEELELELAESRCKWSALCARVTGFACIRVRISAALIGRAAATAVHSAIHLAPTCVVM